MDDPKTYLILEIGTGLVDGYYFGRTYLDDVLDVWNERRPQYPHLIVEVVSGKRGYLPDSMMLNRADLRTR